jgi:hypothetical protein
MRIASAIVIVAIATMTAEAWPHRKDQKARVQFLASSTLVRGTWGLNEDTYFADLHLRPDSEPILVRLIDEYPNEAPPLSTVILSSRSGAMLRVQCDSQCDSPYSRMLLRTAPGDLVAILPARLEYQPLLPERAEPSSVLHCYRTMSR